MFSSPMAWHTALYTFFKKHRFQHSWLPNSTKVELVVGTSVERGTFVLVPCTAQKSKLAQIFFLNIRLTYMLSAEKHRTCQKMGQKPTKTVFLFYLSCTPNGEFLNRCAPIQEFLNRCAPNQEFPIWCAPNQECLDMSFKIQICAEVYYNWPAKLLILVSGLARPSVQCFPCSSESC